MHLDTRRAAARDDLAHTLDYGELARAGRGGAVGGAGRPDRDGRRAHRGDRPGVRRRAGRRRGRAQAATRPSRCRSGTWSSPSTATAPSSRPPSRTSPRADGGRAGVAARCRRRPASFPVTPAPGARAVAAALPAGAWADAVVAPAPGERLGRRAPTAPSTELEPVPAGEAVVVGEVVTDALDQAPDGPVEVVLALGANLGPAQETLREAVTDLARHPGRSRCVDVSALARTSAVGGPEQSDYLNAVVLARTTLAPRELLRATQAIEHAHGRERHERWGPRTLDIDIVRVRLGARRDRRPRAAAPAGARARVRAAAVGAGGPGRGAARARRRTGRRAGRDRTRPRRRPLARARLADHRRSRRSAATPAPSRPAPTGPEAPDT